MKPTTSLITAMRSCALAGAAGPPADLRPKDFFAAAKPPLAEDKAESTKALTAVVREYHHFVSCKPLHRHWRRRTLSHHCFNHFDCQSSCRAGVRLFMSPASATEPVPASSPTNSNGTSSLDTHRQVFLCPEPPVLPSVLDRGDLFHIFNGTIDASTSSHHPHAACSCS